MEVARICRAHGLAGDVLVDLTSDVTERLAPGSILLCGGSTLTVESAHCHAKRWRVHFAGINDRDAADALRGTTLSAQVDDDTPGLWVHELIGRTVVDAHGEEHGQVVAVQANPAHDLLVLEDETLVPSVFIVSVDDVVHVDVPEGIF